MNIKIQKLWDRFKTKAFREAFSDAQIATTVAAQISTMRDDRSWTQSDLAKASGMAQSRISLLEDPSYDRMSLTTLKRIAAAFDVGLSVSFVPFSTIVRSAVDESIDRFSVQGFDSDVMPIAPSQTWSATAVIISSPGKSAKLEIAVPRSNAVVSSYAINGEAHASAAN